MAEAINPINAELKLAQILNEESSLAPSAADPGVAGALGQTTNAFDNLLSKAINSLNSVSQAEMHADRLMQQYRAGQAELHEVMIAQSKANILVQFAVTSINTAVTSFKEILQMQV